MCWTSRRVPWKALLFVVVEIFAGVRDRADYGESYRYYERGNALKKSEISYRPEPIERNPIA